MTDAPFKHQPLPTTLYVDGEPVETWYTGDLPVLPVGTGVLWGDATRYRVVDSWLSFDHNGHFHSGFHVFLEKAKPSDDRLAKLAPDYFPVEPTPSARDNLEGFGAIPRSRDW